MITQNFDNFATFGKANVDALVKSSTSAVEGFKTLTDSCVALVNLSVAQAQDAVKTLSAVKSPVEFASVVTSLTKTNTDAAVAEGRKLQDVINGLVTSSVDQLTARVSAVADLAKVAA